MFHMQKHGVQAGRVADGGFYMRDMDSGGSLYFTDAEGEAFLRGVKDGDFDHLIPDQRNVPAPQDEHPED